MSDRGDHHGGNTQADGGLRGGSIINPVRHDPGRRPRQRRGRGRFLAPVFLIAVIAGTYVIVHHGVVAITHSSSSSTSSVARKRHLTRVQRRTIRAGSYLVQPGDTLTLIARRTGVSVRALMRLNPKISPNSLQLGQRLRLRR